jgi:hypothetical protein
MFSSAGDIKGHKIDVIMAVRGKLRIRAINFEEIFVLLM